MSFKSLFAAAAVAAVLVAPPLAQAAFQTEEGGVTFTINVTDAANGIFTLRIEDLLDATGAGWEDVTQVGALHFKDLGNSFTVAGSTILPGTATASGDELNANGCAGGDSGGICFTFNPLVAATNDMTFTINLNGSIEVGDDGPHLKVNFMNEAGTQIGSLLSANLPGTPEVPEPTTLALLGLGLLAAPYLVRKKAR